MIRLCNTNTRRSSTLSVKIKNGGDSAYQQEVYGDSIIVERHFSRSGSSNFKLKSSTGRLISTRKGDLEEICDYFALQIDNPMNVLTQDMARQFLNSSTPHDKYKFFMKGTQLEHLDGDYLIVEQNLDMIDQDLWKKQEDLKVFEDRAQKARNLLALSERQDTLRDRIRRLSEMMAWVQVEEQEERLAVFNRKLSRTDEKIAASEMKAAGLGQAFSQTEQLSENANMALEQARSFVAPLQEGKDQMKDEFDSLKAEALTLHVVPFCQWLSPLLIHFSRPSKGKFQKKSRLQMKGFERRKVLSEKSTKGSAMLTAEVMTCGVLKLKKREQKLVPPKLDSEIMRTSSLLLKITGIVPRGIIENLKTRSGKRNPRYRTAKSD